MTRRLRIAMIGQRGVPATFGGIEHHVEELGARLVDRGHEVTIFCRPNYVDGRPTTYRGMRLCFLPTIGTKHLDAMVHCAICSLATIGTRYDVVHYHALGPGLTSFIPRFASPGRVVQTVHGLDDERAKWGGLARTILHAAQWMSARVPHATIVVSQALGAHYAQRHARATVYIPNGVRAPRPRPPGIITRQYGLQGGRYVLFVGRLVPEKAPDLLLEAFSRLDGDLKLVIAGGSSFTDEYVQRLHRLAAADSRVILAGYVYGEALEELYTNAAVFVLPSHLEGLPLTLLEAASYGLPVIASAIPPHVEVLGHSEPGQVLFAPGSGDELRDCLAEIMARPEHAQVGGARLRDRVMVNYDWDSVTEQTEDLYLALTSSRG